MECMGGNIMPINDLFKKIDIIQPLKELDSYLNSPERIILAGSSVPILSNCDFRSTMDIDFAILPSSELATIITNHKNLARIFDFNAQGVIGLLIDFEDRIIKVDIGCKYLQIYRLSIMDWVVSKLASPKLDDVLSIEEVDIDMLKEIENKFHLYGGISADRAYRDLKYLISLRS